MIVSSRRSTSSSLIIKIGSQFNIFDCGHNNIPSRAQICHPSTKMVKPLSFKGDTKKVKKRKHHDDHEGNNLDIGSKFGDNTQSSSIMQITKARTSSRQELDAAEHDDQIWVSADAPSDINGPVLIVLPSVSSADPTGDDSITTRIICLACDANGSVFASPIENMIEGDPSTAEPHDVRQVWVATRVPGNEGFSFKGHHGRSVA